ncbi:MAG: DUF342 domain-containing protein [Spirochaetes bacterium]|nr:DUF342 domain-containing protein [Spirochaetota bacterium]MBN2772503.1 DUF342 domain-containing protein [Spirochaetota bacterium]
MKLILLYFNDQAGKMLVQKQNAKGEKVITVSSAVNFAARSEIIARVIDVNNESDTKKYLDQGYTYYKTVGFKKISMGPGVYFEEKDRSYRAQNYGFVTLNGSGLLQVTAPIQVIKEKTAAVYYIVPTIHKRIPSVADINEQLAALKIVTNVDSKNIERDLARIDVNNPRVNRILVAKSIAPVHGRAEFYEPLIDLERKAGKVETDGHINFKEVNSIHEVKKGDPVLKRFPKIDAQAGYTIFGEKAPAITEPTKGLLLGENLVPGRQNPDIFEASVDGCIFLNNRKLSVKEIAIIDGDVDYESGNVNFHGSVQINGNVLPGFTVKAGGDIIIDGNVDDAVIDAGGSVTITLGVAGKGRTEIIAGKDVNAKYLLNSKVEAEGTVAIDESVINCVLLSNDKIIVTSKNGKIMGGKSVARNRIEANSVGSKKETVSDLMVGRNLKVEKIIDDLRHELTEARESVSEQMNILKNSFGNNLFEDPKGFISALPDIKKKNCVVMLNELTIRKNRESEIKEKIEETEKLLVFDEEPQILVYGNVYPGTVITVRREVKKIEETMTNARFYYDKEDKLIRFASCV